MKTFVIYFGVVLIFYSCKHQCPDFNPDALNWIPYHAGDTLTFILNQDTSKAFRAGDINVHHTKNYPAMALCMCVDEIGFIAPGLNSSDQIDLHLMMTEGSIPPR